MLFKQITEVDVEGLSKEEAEKKIKRTNIMNKIKAYSEVAIVVGVSVVVPIAVKHGIGHIIKSEKKENTVIGPLQEDYRINRERAEAKDQIIKYAERVDGSAFSGIIDNGYGRFRVSGVTEPGNPIGLRDLVNILDEKFVNDWENKTDYAELPRTTAKEYEDKMGL